MSATQPPRIEIEPSPSFGAWLAGMNASLCVSTYQSGVLLMMGTKPDGSLFCLSRAIARCMGLHASPQTLWIGSMFQLHRFENTLRPGETDGGCDAFFMPRVSYTTGDVDIHDIGVDAAGAPVFANTLHSCLATVDPRYSFRPLWKPRFISRLAAEDRCHLNGLAMVDGEPGYVTCVSGSDASGGWRDFRQSGGMVLHVRSGEPVCTGLSMPHSPRWYQGRLWVHNSGTGEFGWIDTAGGRFEPVAFCPGYLRGACFIGDFAIVGLSMGRESAFNGLALQENIERAGETARCAIRVIDLRSGELAHELRFLGDVRELFDVAVLPGVRTPGAAGFLSDEIWKRITIDPDALR